jgi:hypothetical protein
MKRKIPKDLPREWLPSDVVPHSSSDLTLPKFTRQKFIDLEYGEFETSLKYLQQAGHSTHPSRKRKHVEQTMMNKYGVSNTSKLKENREKARKTMKERFGYEHALKDPKKVQKMKETNIDRYGLEFGKKRVPKIKETIMNKYGVDNPGKINAYKFKDTTLHEFSVDNKIPYCQLRRIFIENGIEVTEDWVDNYKKYKSSLESEFEKKVIKLESFNKLLNNISYKPDFKASDNLYVDVDGLIWHSDKFKKDKYYHFNKRRDYNNEGLDILQFRQDEIKKHPEIVKSIILSKLGKCSINIAGRKCEIRKVSIKESDLFLINNHLMGPSRGVKSIGLYHNNELVSLITYKRVKNNGIDIVRFCNKIYTNIQGGLSKLLNYIKKNELPTFIQSYVDLRYGNGKSLQTLGFIKESEFLSWKWTDGINTFNRLYCRANMDGRKLKEIEYAKELNLNKIYDAGQAKFIIYI